MHLGMFLLAGMTISFMIVQMRYDLKAQLEWCKEISGGTVFNV